MMQDKFAGIGLLIGAVTGIILHDIGTWVAIGLLLGYSMDLSTRNGSA